MRYLADLFPGLLLLIVQNASVDVADSE